MNAAREGDGTLSGDAVVLHEHEGHRFIWLGLLDRGGDESVQVNQYAIEHGGRTWVLDPGGVLTFPHVIAALARVVDLERVAGLIYSHQDPDVSSGIALWMQVTRGQAYISKHWVRFVPHFGPVDPTRVVPVPDGGMALEIGPRARIQLVPSHFLHSVANFTVFDPASGILFSGDIGASPVDPTGGSIFVDRLGDHADAMAGFHRRYMVSNTVCRRWVDMVSRMDPKMIAPQHGPILRGRAVKEFLAWLRDLRCGVDLLDEVYGGAA